MDTTLARMKRSVQNLGGSAEGYGNPTLLRFLKARSMNPESAAEMFVQWQRWRADFVPNGFISDSQVPEELTTKKAFLQGVSKDGYPILIVKMSRHYRMNDRLQCNRFVVYMWDKAIARGIRGRERGDEKFIFIVDIRNLSWDNLDPRAFHDSLHFLQNYYPERLEKLYVYSMPRLFRYIWKPIRMILRSDILDKVVILKNDRERKEFVEKIGEEVLPEDYGGRARPVPIENVIVPRLNG